MEERKRVQKRKIEMRRKWETKDKREEELGEGYKERLNGEGKERKNEGRTEAGESN